MKPVLVIGNKNASSWSLRPWLAMKQAGVDFDEKLVLLDRPDTKSNIKAQVPEGNGKVPALRHGEVTVWESLAICEYVAETWAPSLWPEDKVARAFARSISHEMHAGFASLRKACPMNLKLDATGATLSPEAGADAYRVNAIWRKALARYGGPFLLGAHFTIADAMYAPVVTRFTSYGIPCDDAGQRYLDHMWALPAMQEWKAAALAEAAVV